MPIGRVKRFDEKKGYGFIVCDEHPQDIFVHYSDILEVEGFKTLVQGEEVEFDLVDGGKGLKAANVKKIS